MCVVLCASALVNVLFVAGTVICGWLALVLMYIVLVVGKVICVVPVFTDLLYGVLLVSKDAGADLAVTEARFVVVMVARFVSEVIAVRQLSMNSVVPGVYVMGFVKCSKAGTVVNDMSVFGVAVTVCAGD